MTAKEHRKFHRLIEALPDDQGIEVYEDALWLVNVGDPVAARALFPHAIWKKEREDAVNWWWYRATLPTGEKVIFNTFTAPASCRAIVEEYEATETAFEEKTVIKTRTRWECGPEAVTA